jgi:hypothetical protein
MRTLGLAAIVLEAEQLRWRLLLRRRLYQAALLGLTITLLIAAMIAGEMALYALLAARLEPAGAAGCLAGGNAVLAAVAALVAFNSQPVAAEREAEAVSLAARGAMWQGFAWTRLAMLLIGRLRAK